MRKFLVRLLLFFLFLFVIFYALHIYMVKLPNDYNNKNRFLTENASEVKILCLGNSQMLYGINPEFFSEKGFNLASVSQSLDIDYLLFDKYYEKLDSLEYLIVQMSYISLFETLGFEGDSWRVLNYERYFSIYPPYDKSKLLDFYIITERNNLLKFEDHLKGKRLVFCNQYGFDEHYTYAGRQTDFTESAEWTSALHKASTFDLLDRNRNYLEKTIDKARSRGIKIVILIPPVHKSYQERLEEKQLDKMYSTVSDILSKNNNITFLDWSQDARFSDDDFYDCDHLNNLGAKKLTLMLDSLLYK